jgi:uncharacterized membrane protein YhaH (DUF805 family)
MDADSLALAWSLTPPDTMPVAAGVTEPLGYVLGGMLWWVVGSVALIFVVLALVDWKRAHDRGRQWPWDSGW